VRETRLNEAFKVTLHAAGNTATLVFRYMLCPTHLPVFIGRPALFVAACLAIAAREQQSDAGYVFEVWGSWPVAPQFAPDLRHGQGLREDETVNSKTAEAHCNDDQNTCRRDITIHADSGPTTTRLRSILDRILKPATPPVYFTVSRRPSDEKSLRGGIIPLSNERPEFAEVLKGSGTQRAPNLFVAPGAPVQLLGPAAMAGRLTSRASGRLRPGLYTAGLSNDKSELSAIVLLAASRTAEKLRGDFSEAETFSAAWDEQMRRNFLVSVLEVLNREQNGR
jgi:hypothetical protein